jgi:LacI family transcriptional regulator
VTLAGQSARLLEVEYPGDLTPAWEKEQISMLVAWLGQMPRPAAVMACNDMQALHVLTAAQNLGLHVPEELAVIGANNDLNRCDLSRPGLSSVAVNAFQSGYQAAECLDALMSKRKPESLDRRIDPLSVVMRQSTDILAINDKVVASALNFIREHACRGITVDQMLRQVFASRSVLEKKFRAHLGRSPQAEIRRVQVAKISQLLYETDFPLKKIAELTGFEHVEYLCVVFKRLTGEAPGAYRKRVQSAA